MNTEELALLGEQFETAPASTVIRWAVEKFGDSLVLAASFEDIVLIHLATKIAPDMEVVFLDTEAHFPETLAFVEEVRSRYGLNLTVTKPGPEASAYPCGSAIFPEHGRRRDVVTLGYAGSPSRYFDNKLLDAQHYVDAQHRSDNL